MEIGDGERQEDSEVSQVEVKVCTEAIGSTTSSIGHAPSLRAHR